MLRHGENLSTSAVASARMRISQLAPPFSVTAIAVPKAMLVLTVLGVGCGRLWWQLVGRERHFQREGNI